MNDLNGAQIPLRDRNTARQTDVGQTEGSVRGLVEGRYQRDVEASNVTAKTKVDVGLRPRVAGLECHGASFERPEGAVRLRGSVHAAAWVLPLRAEGVAAPGRVGQRIVRGRHRGESKGEESGEELHLDGGADE